MPLGLIGLLLYVLHLHPASVSKAVRAKLIALKVQNPNARFRLEAHGLTRESVVTQISGESGLEQPEEFFVELESFEKEHGKADPNDVVFEETVPGSGILKAGVTWSES